MFIYLLTNTINGKVYVGKTETTVEGRWKDHCKAAKRGRNSRLYGAMRKYGVESFAVRTLAAGVWNSEALNELEKFYIKLYESTGSERGYNLTEGGDGGRQTAEVRARMSAKARERVAIHGVAHLHVFTPQRLAAQSIGTKKWWQEKKAETARLGLPVYRPRSMYTKFRLSEEAKQKIGSANRQRHRGWETRNCLQCDISFTIEKVKPKHFCNKACANRNRAEKQRGVPRTAEDRQKMSDTKRMRRKERAQLCTA